MISIKKKMTKIIDEQPEDSSYEEILKELAFERMVERGLADSRSGKTVSDAQLKRRIKLWQK
jgi:ribosomal protein S3AE